MKNIHPAPENLPVPLPQHHKFIDRTGQKFHRLTVIAYAGKVYGNRTGWRCLCECGGQVVVESGILVSGRQKSCGCINSENLIERNTKHNNAGRFRMSPEYKIWRGLKTRCTNPKNHCFKNYGARGITICERWMDFQAFLDDMGPKPSQNHSIDRIENSKGYEPGNCRWSTPVEQANNKRNNLIVELGGVKKTLPEWCRELSFNYGTVIMRLRSGLTPEEAFEMVPCGRVRVSAKLGG